MGGGRERRSVPNSALPKMKWAAFCRAATVTPSSLTPPQSLLVSSALFCSQIPLFLTSLPPSFLPPRRNFFSSFFFSPILLFCLILDNKHRFLSLFHPPFLVVFVYRVISQIFPAFTLFILSILPFLLLA